MKKMLSFVLLAAAVVAVAGCNPLAPSSGGYNPGKAISEDNWPPGPCAHQSEAICDASRATLHSLGVFEGECQWSSDGCGRQVPLVDGLGVLMRGQTYTAWLCVRHASVPGRKINMKNWVHIPNSIRRSQFDEGGQASPACLASVSFVATEATYFIGMDFLEGEQDLFETTSWGVDLNLRTR